MKDEIRGLLMIKTADGPLKNNNPGQIDFISQHGQSGYHGEAKLTGKMLELLNGTRNRRTQRHSAVS